MTTVRTQQATNECATVRSLTGGQIAVLVLATLPMVAVGIAGAIGTYANATAVLHRSQTAIGVVAAGEGATLVAALVMIGVTMLGQPAPAVVRAALWILPVSASVMGIAIAPAVREAVVYGLTPLAMTAAAEGISFLARRIVAHTTGVDVEAQRRNAEVMRQIAFHRARAERHPDEKERGKSELKAWELMQKVGLGDAELGSGLITVQRDRLTEGADGALQTMLTGTREPHTTTPLSRALETAHTPTEPTPEPAPQPLALTPNSEPRQDTTPAQPFDSTPIIQPADQHLRREPVLSPSEPTPTLTANETSEPTASEPEPGANEKEQQVVDLAQRLKSGEQLTKTTAAQILGVSPATAGRRLKDARDRVNDGTGMYL